MLSPSRQAPADQDVPAPASVVPGDATEILQAITDTALTHLRLEALMAELLARIRAALRGDTATILLLSEDGRYLDVRASDGLQEEVTQRVRVPLGRGVAGRLAQEEGPVVLPDLRRVEVVSPWLRRQIRSLVGCRMLVEGRLVGVVHVGTIAPRHFTEDEARFLQLVADRIGLALEHARLYRAVAERERLLQALVSQLLLTQEEERRRVALEVHDGVAQVAAGAFQHLQLFASHYHPRSARARSQLERALTLAQRTVREARQVIAGLRPMALDDLGLEAAIQIVVEELRRDGLEVRYDRGLGPRRLAPEIEVAIFRVAQEALRNLRRHARTRRARVALRRRGRWVFLRVRDWGEGFLMPASVSGGAPGEHTGLQSMRHRVSMLGGRFRVLSEPGHGTTIAVAVPLPEPIVDEP